MKKFDFIKAIIRISKEFVYGHDFDALYHSLKLTYSVNGEFAIGEMLRFVDNLDKVNDYGMRLVNIPRSGIGHIKILGGISNLI